MLRNLIHIWNNNCWLGELHTGNRKSSSAVVSLGTPWNTSPNKLTGDQSFRAFPQVILTEIGGKPLLVVLRRIFHMIELSRYGQILPNISVGIYYIHSERTCPSAHSDNWVNKSIRMPTHFHRSKLCRGELNYYLRQTS